MKNGGDSVLALARKRNLVRTTQGRRCNCDPTAINRNISTRHPSGLKPPSTTTTGYTRGLNSTYCVTRTSETKIVLSPGRVCPCWQNQSRQSLRRVYSPQFLPFVSASAIDMRNAMSRKAPTNTSDCCHSVDGLPSR